MKTLESLAFLESVTRPVPIRLIIILIPLQADIAGRYTVQAFVELFTKYAVFETVNVNTVLFADTAVPQVVKLEPPPLIVWGIHFELDVCHASAWPSVGAVVLVSTSLKASIEKPLKDTVESMRSAPSTYE